VQPGIAATSKSNLGGLFTKSWQMIRRQGQEAAVGNQKPGVSIWNLAGEIATSPAAPRNDK